MANFSSCAIMATVNAFKYGELQLTFLYFNVKKMKAGIVLSRRGSQLYLEMKRSTCQFLLRMAKRILFRRKKK